MFASATALASGPAPTVLDKQGSLVAAYGGWAAWSRSDATTKHYALALRSPQGAISLAPVAESATPFDVELGPNGSGVAAVYSRCANAAAAKGCHIAELELGVAGAIERTLAPPGGGSVHEPAIWKSAPRVPAPQPRGRASPARQPLRLEHRQPQAADQQTLPVSQGQWGRRSLAAAA